MQQEPFPPLVPLRFSSSASTEILFNGINALQVLRALSWMAQGVLNLDFKAKLGSGGDFFPLWS